MTGLYIFLGIVLFFAFILSLKARVRLEFNDELILKISVLCFTIKILPGKEKKPIDYSEYTYEKHQKRLQKKYDDYLKKQEKKQQKAENKKKKKEAKKAETPEQKKARKAQPKRSISDWINIAVGVLAIFFEKFTRHFHIKVARLKVNVATGDAASTAILYGAVIQSVAYAIEILSRVTNVDGLEKAEIEVNPDYLSEKTTLDLCFVFSLRVWHLFDILFGIIGRAIKRFLATSPEGKAKAEGKATPPTKRRRRKKRKKSSPAKQTVSNESKSNQNINNS